ncbi:MAG: hypothetical protein ABWX82_03395 [Leifsonia sp.]
MRGILTLLFIGGILFVGYVYGAKAGRGRYRDIRASFDALWNDPRVKKARKQAKKDSEKLLKAAEKKVAKTVKAAS